MLLELQRSGPCPPPWGGDIHVEERTFAAVPRRSVSRPQTHGGNTQPPGPALSRTHLRAARGRAGGEGSGEEEPRTPSLRPAVWGRRPRRERGHCPPVHPHHTHPRQGGTERGRQRPGRDRSMEREGSANSLARPAAAAPSPCAGDRAPARRL